MKLNIREAVVLDAVLRRMRVHPRVAWIHRMNVGAVQVRRARFLRFSFTGCSDLIGQLIDGRFLAIECKAPAGRLTGDQSAFLERVKRHRGVAGVARSIEDAEHIVEAA